MNHILQLKNFSIAFLFLIFSFNNVFGIQLPADFPVIKIDTINNPTKGYTFLNSLSFGGKTVNYNFIIDSVGEVFYFKKPLIAAIDFKMQPNGLFSYGSPVKLGSKYQAGPLTVQNVMVEENILDSSFNLIDKVQMKNGYLADVHDFAILPNGHYLLMSYESNPTDMSKLLEGGDPNAVVIGTVIQELDQNKKCVFQWRSTDYIPILETFDDPTHKTFEHVHGNSLFIDNDGNLIASFATTNEIVKIDMVSGDLIWRLGGRKNQFKFNNEHSEMAPIYFSMSHDAKKLSNGNLLFYDNGVMKKTWYSRAVEYKIDEVNKEVDLVWEYRHQPDISAYAMGSVQRFKNGNSLINWGLIFKGYFKTLTEVDATNQIQFEMSLPNDAYSYRAFKYDLPACQPVANVDKYEVLKGNTYIFRNLYDTTGVSVYFKEFNGFIYNVINVKKFECAPKNPAFSTESPVLLPLRYVLSADEVIAFGGEFKVELSTLPKLMLPSDMKIFFREKEGEGVFAELETSIDANNKFIVGKAFGFGEYVIGLKRSSNVINPPTLLYPFNQAKLLNDSLVFINWSPTGRYDYCYLQISTDSEFLNIVFDTTLWNDTRYFAKLENDITYFWRVKSYYKDYLTDWSNVREFSLTQPFLSLINPNGNETFLKDSSITIKWNSNLQDSLKITLLQNDEEIAVIADSLFSYSNSFKWTIPMNVPDGKFYKVKVQKIKDGSELAISQDNFTITSSSGIDDNIKNFTFSYYPNPVNDKLDLNLELDNSDFTSIKIIDIMGQTSLEVLREYLTNGKYRFSVNTQSLPNGVYFLQLTNGTIVNTQTLLINH